MAANWTTFRELLLPGHQRRRGVEVGAAPGDPGRAARCRARGCRRAATWPRSWRWRAGTVTSAYTQLVAEGYLTARRGSGDDGREPRAGRRVRCAGAAAAVAVQPAARPARAERVSSRRVGRGSSGGARRAPRRGPRLPRPRRFRGAAQGDRRLPVARAGGRREGRGDHQRRGGRVAAHRPDAERQHRDRGAQPLRRREHAAVARTQTPCRFRWTTRASGSTCCPKRTARRCWSPRHTSSRSVWCCIRNGGGRSSTGRASGTR